jgi:hypothetical protein
MTWSRRQFLKTGSIVIAGGIFVPKFERWYRFLEPKVLPLGPGHIEVRAAGVLLVRDVDYAVVDVKHGVLMVTHKVKSEPNSMPMISISYDAEGEYGKPVRVVNEQLGFHLPKANQYYRTSRRNLLERRTRG